MATVETPTANERVEQRFVFRCADWDQYCAIIDAFGEQHLRVAYDGANLEIMTVSRLHDWLGYLFARIIIVLTEEFRRPLSGAGSMTLNREDLERGIEPDKCFYIDNAPLIRHKNEIDLLNDPPPDLAVEIDVTRSSLDRFGIYAKLGIPEIWRCDGEQLIFYQLDEDYRETKYSQFFPNIEAADLMTFIARRTAMDEYELFKEFREWVQKRVAENA